MGETDRPAEGAKAPEEAGGYRHLIELVEGLRIEVQAVYVVLAELRSEQARLAEEQTRLAAEQVNQGKRTWARLDAGSKRMQQQDRSLVFQGRVIRTVGQLAEICDNLNKAVADSKAVLEQQEEEAMERIINSESKYPQDAPTRRINEVPVLDAPPVPHLPEEEG